MLPDSFASPGRSPAFPYVDYLCRMTGGLDLKPDFAAPRFPRANMFDAWGNPRETRTSGNEVNFFVREG